MYKTSYSYNPQLYLQGSCWYFEKLKPAILNNVIPINGIGRALITYFDFVDDMKNICYIDFKILQIDEQYVDIPFDVKGPQFCSANNPMLYLKFQER